MQQAERVLNYRESTETAITTQAHDNAAKLHLQRTSFVTFHTLPKCVTLINQLHCILVKGSFFSNNFRRVDDVIQL